jgi:membrane protein DedA with SNARE-associated domain
MLPSFPDLDRLLLMLAAHPMLLFLLIAGLTLLLEDATALAAGGLAMAGRLDPALALSALLVGTIAGDLLLHGAGRLARRSRRVARWAARHKGVRRVGGSMLSVAAARFVPGLRFPAYVGSGIAGLGVVPVLAVVGATALIWTPGLFLFGQALVMAGPWVAGAAIAAMLLGPRLLAASRTRALRPGLAAAPWR